MKHFFNSQSLKSKRFCFQEVPTPPNLEDLTDRVCGETHQECEALITDIQTNRLLSGQAYAEHIGLVIETPPIQADFERVWNERLAAQAADDFTGMYLPAELKDRVWDHVVHTLETHGLGNEGRDEALELAIEREALFLKMAALDEPPTDENGQVIPFTTVPIENPDGTTTSLTFATEGDYLDYLAIGDPTTPEDNIDPQLLAYLRATNALNWGRDQDQGTRDQAQLRQQTQTVLDQLRSWNISDFESLNNNVEAAATAAGIDPAQVAQLQQNYDALGQPTAPGTEPMNLLQRFLWYLLKYLHDEDYANEVFSRQQTYSTASGQRYGASGAIQLETGGATASNELLNQLLEDENLSPARREILAATAGDLGLGENNRALMAACSQAGGMAAGPNPWCMMWVQKIMRQTNNPNARTTAWARDGLLMGQDATSNPQPGDIVVVARGNGGHIGFYLGTSANGNPIIVGGNQSNMVSVMEERRPLLGIRRVV